ncbi:MAG TPA: 2-C-methyl-D-erythritol 2,4-cyclodiphosphate synthase [candidate division Zixibacteria bacterium]|nr:2-C-methyl-D-erythritol 2,4-cyclodiphosphate synthase [candidate division Zixibacteria bacterium]
MSEYRIGYGYDVHALVSGRKLILGGVEIKHDKGLDGHSDADVLLHAICDSILGAAAVGDIGKHFPPNDPRFKNISSLMLLQKVQKLAAESGWHLIENIDSTIMAERPHLQNYIPEMQNKIAQVLSIQITQISIKATTTEGLGFVGREEGMAAAAVCLLKKNG